MNKISIGILLYIVAMFSTPVIWAAERRVKIIQPVSNAQLISPVKVCMEVSGLVVEEAKKGVNEGRGHHHLLLDALPVDLSQPIDKQEIHMGDGSTCKKINFVPGRHIIYSIFAYGNHVPYDPPITDRIIITIKE